MISFNRAVEFLLGEGYVPDELVVLKHHSIRDNLLPRYYKEHKPGDVFKVIERDSVNTTNPNPRYIIQSVDTGKKYRAYAYHIQSADKPLVQVKKFEKRLRGPQKCANCGQVFSLDPPPGKKHRDHCPYCLSSVHIDVRPGDRGMWCGEGVPGDKDFKPSVLEPVGKIPIAGEPDIIKYICKKCGKVKYNVSAVDDNKELVNNLPIVDPPKRLKRYNTAKL
jgi:DNA-directed RNA polymerase subunit RPC12/RpoP